MRAPPGKPVHEPKRAPSPRALAEQRRREIIDEAARLMEEKGFAAMSVREVANTLVFSKANFYHHIASKEDLLYEIFVETLQLGIRSIGEIVSQDRAALDKLRAVVEFYVFLATERRAEMLVWFRERAHLTDAHRKAVTELELQLTNLLKKFYSQGIAEGAFRRIDVDVLRWSVFGMCFMLTRLGPSSPPTDVIKRQLLELLTTGIAPHPRRTTKPQGRVRSGS